MHNTQGPPPRTGVRKNPKTGKTETYELPAPVDLARSRKELADVLHGGGWFDDPLAKPPEPGEEPPQELVNCPFCGISRFGEGWHCEEPPASVCPLWGGMVV